MVTEELTEQQKLAKEKESIFQRKKDRFLKQWSDTRPTKQCKGCFGISKGLGQERCSISISPSYWWKTRSCCPVRKRDYAT